MGADGWLCSLLYDVQQALSLGPCIDAVHGAPGHNRWGVVETPLPAKSQGRTVDCLLTSCHHVLLRGGLLSVVLRSPQTSPNTGVVPGDTGGPRADSSLSDGRASRGHGRASR